MHIIAESAFCHRQITGCGTNWGAWYITAIVAIVAVIAVIMIARNLPANTPGRPAPVTRPGKRSPLSCSGTGSGAEGAHYHNTFAEVDRCEGTRP